MCFSMSHNKTENEEVQEQGDYGVVACGCMSGCNSAALKEV